MGITNPRLLALLLDDLIQDLEWWALRSSDLLGVATVRAREWAETLLQCDRSVQLAVEQAREDTHEAHAILAEAEDAQGRNQDQLAVSTATMEDAEQHVAKAAAAHAHWQGQLAHARAWQARAEQRVKRAEEDLANAQAALHHAERELRDAKAALAACQSYRDDKGRGRNCSGPAARVLAAQVQVNNAIAWVNRAQAELADAKAELQRALRRVAACTTAVDFCDRAAIAAQDGQSRATDALTSIERALEATAAANAMARKCLELAGLQEAAADEALVALHIAQQFHDDSMLHLRSAEQSEEAGQRLRILAAQELTLRVDALHTLDTMPIQFRA